MVAFEELGWKDVGASEFNRTTNQEDMTQISECFEPCYKAITMGL